MRHLIIVSYPVTVPVMKDPRVLKHASMQFSNTPDAVLPVSSCDVRGGKTDATDLQGASREGKYLVKIKDMSDTWLIAIAIPCLKKSVHLFVAKVRRPVSWYGYQTNMNLERVQRHGIHSAYIGIPVERQPEVWERLSNPSSVVL